MGSQNGSQNNAKTHQKSLPKIETTKNHEKHQNHVSLNGKIFEIHNKTNVLEVVEGCMCER